MSFVFITSIIVSEHQATEEFHHISTDWCSCDLWLWLALLLWIFSKLLERYSGSTMSTLLKWSSRTNHLKKMNKKIVLDWQFLSSFPKSHFPSWMDAMIPFSYKEKVTVLDVNIFSILILKFGSILFCYKKQVWFCEQIKYLWISNNYTWISYSF